MRPDHLRRHRGAAMELYDMGMLNKEQIGMDAPFGSAQALVNLAEMTAKGEGFGKETGPGLGSG